MVVREDASGELISTEYFDFHSLYLREWRNWQTRRVTNPVEIYRGGSNPLSLTSTHEVVLQPARVQKGTSIP